METRAKLYLINSYVSEIFGATLPSYRQTFSYFMYLHKVQKLTIREASSATIKAVSEIWDKASIPTCSNQHSITKLESIFSEWKGLQKHKNRTTQAHKEKENKFVDRLEESDSDPTVNQANISI